MLYQINVAAAAQFADYYARTRPLTQLFQAFLMNPREHRRMENPIIKPKRYFAAKAAAYCALTVGVAAIFGLASAPWDGAITPPATIAYTAPYEQLYDDIARTRSAVRDARADVAGAATVLVGGVDLTDDQLADAMIDTALRAVNADPRLESHASAALDAFGVYQRANDGAERAKALSDVDFALSDLRTAARELADSTPAALRLGEQP